MTIRAINATNADIANTLDAELGREGGLCRQLLIIASSADIDVSRTRRAWRRLAAALYVLCAEVGIDPDAYYGEDVDDDADVPVHCLHPDCCKRQPAQD